MRLLSIVSALLGFLAVSCNDCTDCEPFIEEPNLLVRFYNLSDSSRRVIIIDTVNQVASGALRHFADTTYSFRFPLDMNNDNSEFELVYRDTAALEIYLTNTINVSYTRDFIKRDDNYIIVQCGITSFSSNFSQENLECKENGNNECISNEAKTSVYN